MQKKAFKIFAVVAVTILMMCGGAFAGSQTTNPTTKLTDTTSPAAVGINPFHVTEVGDSGFNSAGYFRLVIPSSVAIQQIESSTPGKSGGEITRDTTTLGSKASPKDLCVQNISGTEWAIVVKTNGSKYGLMKVYSSGGSGGAIVYCPAAAAGNSGDYVQVAAWDNAAAIGSNTSDQVGEIYYDDTTNETVITLAGATNTNKSEEIWFNGIYLKPTTPGATGSVNLSILDKDADGNNGIGITDDPAVEVLNMTDQPMFVKGSAPPTIPAGKVKGQPTGKIEMTFVGNTTPGEIDNKITITLDNGAKFHTGAASILGDNDKSKAINIKTSAGTSAWEAYFGGTPKNAGIAVNASGALVITLGTNDFDDAVTVTLPDSTEPIIDTSGVTASGDINAKVTGSGTDLAKLDQTVKIATVAVTGTTVAFKDESPSGLKTLYIGRTGETIPDSLLIGENAPGSLLSGGIIQVDLNLGAKFTASDSITAKEYATSPYAGLPSGITINTPYTAATASSTYKSTVSGNTTAKRAAFTLEDWSFDLTKATPGALQMTVSGNAGAAGTVTMATVINATDTTVAAPPTLVPGSAAVTLGDITITENHFGALDTSTDGIYIHFPTGITLDTNATVTVTSVGKTSGNSSTSAVTGSIDSNGQDLHLDVVNKSTSTSGPYTITISGLVADVSSSIGSGDANLTITGYTTSSSKKGANEGAKPTPQTVKFATVVSSTVPFIGTPVVSGTAVTQTFIPAGNDINKVGDVYVFTSASTTQFYDGSAWTTTETKYLEGATLDTMQVAYDVKGLATGTKIYVGYGVGMTGTFTNMNSSASFVLAYTTPASVETGKTAGPTDVEFNVADNIDLYLNITNDDGVAYADIQQEWLVFGATVNGVDAGFFFFDDSGAVTQFDSSLDLSTVTYTFDHSVDSFNVTTLNLGKLGLSAGDTFWYGYVYSKDGIDLTDPSTFSVENYVVITGK